jgi:hypothetical protein
MRTLTLIGLVVVCPQLARADDDEMFRRRRAEEPRGHTSVILSLSALVSPNGLAGIGMVTIPFDRVVKGAAQMHASFAYLPATPDVARMAVTAAWRVSGLGTNDASLDAMASRARWSAVLPEARLRILRHATDSTHATTTDSTTTDTPYYAYDSNSLWIEGRVTWHLDRLLFAEEEPTIERLRLDRQEQRMRIAAKVVEQISKWQRAHFDSAQSPDGSLDKVDALMREMEAASALDVMTAGWFSRWQLEGEK